jgi:hypothetical protein
MTHVCFGIVPAVFNAAVGISQIQIRPGEWGFARGSSFWGPAFDQYYWTPSANDRPRRKIVWDLRTH